MARVKHKLEIDLAARLSMACLVLGCPMPAVTAALTEHDALSKRKRQMTHEVLVYYVLCMCLYRRYSCEEVVRVVLEGLRSVYGDTIESSGVTKGAISTARKQIGSAPLKTLYERQVTPVGNADMPGVFFSRWWLMALDGSTLDVADEQGNAQAFGYPASSRGASAQPQLRFCALAECGTQVMIGAQMGGCATSELALASQVIDSAAKAGMLIICDRYYIGHGTWLKILATGAQALVRLRKSQQLPVLQTLADGSYLSEIYPDNKSRRSGKGQSVRIIHYQLEGSTEQYRIATSLLSPEHASAQELAQLYARRWKIEQALDEIKTHLNDNLTLRSKTPELVKQEFYALMLTHAAIRGLMTKAAARTQQASEDLSFTRTVHVLHRRLAATAALPP